MCVAEGCVCACVQADCTKWYSNWTLSLATMDCVKVPPGPNKTAHDPPVWHSVVAISCAEMLD